MGPLQTLHPGKDSLGICFLVVKKVSRVLISFVDINRVSQQASQPASKPASQQPAIMEAARPTSRRGLGGRQPPQEIKFSTFFVGLNSAEPTSTEFREQLVRFHFVTPRATVKEIVSTGGRNKSPQLKHGGQTQVNLLKLFPGMQKNCLGVLGYPLDHYPLCTCFVEILTVHLY